MANKNILLIGAGRSANTLVKYLAEHAAAYRWQISIADMDEELAQKKAGNSGARPMQFNATDGAQREREIEQCDIVISMLPARLHHLVAATCLKLGKNMVTASYVSPEVAAMDKAARKQNLLFLNEMGLDPGLDHLSAMQEIDAIRKAGGKMLNFESFAGGLLAPESETGNPWRYKFTWNPRNVVLAGQGTVKFRQEGKYKYIPYHRLFRRTEFIDIEGYGRFEGYANRDSLKYLDVYGLSDIPTIYRGTLRRPGFCRAWNVFVQLGATDDSYVLEGSEEMTHRDFINSFLSYNPRDSVELKLMHYLKIEQDSDIMEKLEWLGVFSNEPVGLKEATPARILQHILEKKWSLEPDEKDMIVMWHQFVFQLNGEVKKQHSWMVVTGDDPVQTAMAKTVGLPLGIATKLILNGEIDLKGVQVPTHPEIYQPVLRELEGQHIKFTTRLQKMEGTQVYM